VNKKKPKDPKIFFNNQKGTKVISVSKTKKPILVSLSQRIYRGKNIKLTHDSKDHNIPSNKHYSVRTSRVNQ